MPRTRLSLGARNRLGGSLLASGAGQALLASVLEDVQVPVRAPREDGVSTAPRGAATPRQLQAIGRIARAKGLDPGAVEGMSLRAFNRKPDALTTGEASALIRELSTMRRVAA